MTKTAALIQLWQEGRTRLTQQLPKINEEDLAKRLHPHSNSIGFLLRHIGEIEHLFSKNVFDMPVEAKVYTLGLEQDKGQFINLKELLEYVNTAAQILKEALEAQNDLAWETEVHTKEFGTKTKQEALARILTHTAYHAGQIAIILKYGQRYDAK
jgi:uncharacterized damage-inducible protein DinB